MNKTINTLKNSVMIFVVVCFMIAMGIWVGYGTSPLELLPGLSLYIVICIIGVLLAEIVPIPFPAVGWVAIVGILFSIPGLLPWAESFSIYSDKIPFIATATPALAYAGVAVGKDWDKFKKIGWRGIIISMLVFAGTFIGSAIVAEIVLRITNQV